MKNLFVIFDQDGVILDSEPIHFKALRSYFISKGVEHYTLDIHESFFGYNQKSFFTALKEQFQMLDSVTVLMEEAKEFYKHFEHEITLMPNVVDIFEALKKHKTPTALATSTNRELTHGNLSRFKIDRYFSYTICGDEVQNGKPNPEIYHRAQMGLQTKAKKGFAIEDSPAGIQSAKESGLIVIAYKTHHNQKANLSQADYQFSSHKDILQFLLEQ